MKKCLSCPRKCSVDRESGERGFCLVGREYVVSLADLHMWEEPCISGKRGSGAIFFSGCNMRCVFCQNKDISRAPVGKIYNEESLISAMQELEERGAHNINLVTPTPYAIFLAKTLEKAKKRISLPIIYNCGGYESLESLAALDGLVDVYLPDFKYFSDDLAYRYSGIRDYKDRASEAISEMFRQTGKVTLDEKGMIKRGVVVRHLVLPSSRADSFSVLDRLAKIVPPDEILLSLMRQYTPEFLDSDAPSELSRRITSFEYDSVLRHATELGFIGFSQSKESATSSFTPRFLSND